MKSFWVRGHLGCLLCWAHRSMDTWDYAPSAHELAYSAMGTFPVFGHSSSRGVREAVTAVFILALLDSAWPSSGHDLLSNPPGLYPGTSPRASSS